MQVAYPLALLLPGPIIWGGSVAARLASRGAGQEGKARGEEVA